MGRPAKPTIIKMLEGNRSKRPLNRFEPQPAGTMPKCPDWLDREAKAAWRRTAKVLHPIGLLTEADADALAMYCQCYSRWKAAETVVAQKGTTYDLLDKHGNVRCVQQRPEVSISRAMLDVMTKLAREFGCTPAARSRMMLLPPAVQEKNQWEGLLANAE